MTTGLICACDVFSYSFLSLLLLLATNLSLHILLFSKERSPYDGRTYESYRHDVHIRNGVFEWVSLGSLGHFVFIGFTKDFVHFSV